MKIKDTNTYKQKEAPKEFEYSFNVILQTLILLKQRSEFPSDSSGVGKLVREIADYVCDILKDDVDSLKEINLLFAICPERTAIKMKSPGERFIILKGKNYKVYEMYCGYNNKYGTMYEKGIRTKGHICWLEVISRHSSGDGDYITDYGSNIIFNERKFAFEWGKDLNDYLLTPESSPVSYCEGRRSEVNCKISNLPFWWCYGRKCFNANQSNHDNKPWKDYSLSDILNILNIPFSEGGYYLFVSEINRLNRILARIKCNECSKVLKPSKQTKFGFYRVSSFHCTNNACSQNVKEVYLTHCLNSRCANVIDSRVAKRCSNGFIICDVCGSCCSNIQFSRRISSLQINGIIVPQKLHLLLESEKGHWERAQCFCYKCNKEMEEDKYGVYRCNACWVQYERYLTYIKFYSLYEQVKKEKLSKSTKDHPKS
jgi:hypothetical protein